MKTKEAPKLYATADSYLKATYPGIQIVDAKKPLAVTVTPTDERLSSRKDPRSCALAVACNRQEDVEDAIVTRTFAYLVYKVRRGRGFGYKAVRHQLPRRSMNALANFDRTGEFPAGEYRFSAPAPSNTLGNGRVSHNTYTGAKKGPRAHKRLPGLRTAITAS